MISSVCKRVLDGFWNAIAKVFGSTVRVITDLATKAVTDAVKDASGIAKDVTGIRRDLVETKLAQYKVEDHESLIQKATLDDVKEYDNTFRSLKRKIAERVMYPPGLPFLGFTRRFTWAIIVAVLAGITRLVPRVALAAQLTCATGHEFSPR